MIDCTISWFFYTKYIDMYLMMVSLPQRADFYAMLCHMLNAENKLV